MFPFINLGFIQLPMYGLMILLGLIVAFFIAKYLIKVKSLQILDFIIIAALTICFGFVGAKVLYLFVSVPLKDIIDTLIDLLFVPENSQIQSGFVFYGGLLGGILGFFVGVKIADVHITDYLDIFAIIVPLVHGFGRIGCLFAGCCYGKPYQGFLSITVTSVFSSAPHNISLFPVQLLEAICLLSIAFFLFLIVLKKKFENCVFFIYLIMYSFVRFFIEFLRFDYYRGFVGVLSVSQFISIVLFCFSIGLLFLKNKLKTLTFF